MAEAVREDGQRLLALNELYVGHQTHQSSRYVISALGRSERHSSSGVIVATGTGSTGWARSVATQRKIEEPLPGPEERRLAFFVREPFPSVFTQTDLDFGLLGHDDRMTLDSLLGDDGVVFADGIETDRLEFLDGQRVTIGVAPERLRLVVSASG